MAPRATKKRTRSETVENTITQSTENTESKRPKKRSRRGTRWPNYKESDTLQVLQEHEEEEEEEEEKEEEYGEEYDDKVYPVEKILDERDDAYLVEWQDIDPKTGKIYKPSWIDKSGPTPVLIRAWNAKKAAREANIVAKRAAKKPKAKKSTPKSTPRKGARRSIRHPQVTSDSESSIRLPTTAQQAPTVTEEQNPDSESRLKAASPSFRPAILIQVEKTDSFEAADYQLFSQLPTSASQSYSHSSSTISSAPPESELGTSPASSPVPRLATRSFISSGIVADSQSSNGSADYTPTTQEASKSNQEQDSATVSGTNDTADDDSLFIAEGPRSRQSSRRPASTFDPIETSSQPTPQPVDPEVSQESLEIQDFHSQQDIGTSVEISDSHSQEERGLDTTIEIPESSAREAPQSLEQKIIIEKSVVAPETTQVLPENQDFETLSYKNTASELIEEAILLTSTAPSPALSDIEETEKQYPVTQPETLEQAVGFEIEPASRALDPSERGKQRSSTPEREASKQTIPNTSVEDASPDLSGARKIENTTSEPELPGSSSAERPAEQPLTRPFAEIVEQDTAALVEEAHPPTALENDVASSVSWLLTELDNSVRGNAQEPIFPQSGVSGTELEQISQGPIVSEAIERRTPTPVQEAQSTVIDRSPSIKPPSQGANSRSATPSEQHLQQAIPETVRASRLLQVDTRDGSVDRRDFAPVTLGENFKSPTTPTTVSSATSFSEHLHTQQEQNAQVVSTGVYLSSTQDESLGSIRPTTEVWDFDQGQAATPESRHDSSQESPTFGQTEVDSSRISLDNLSPAPRPPPYSIEAPNSTAPPRPESPITSSVSAAMADPNSSDVHKSFQALFTTSTDAKPFTPKKRIMQTGTPTPVTRSPSVISNRAPQEQQQEPPSLRTSALKNSAAVQMEEAPPFMPAPAIADVPEIPSVLEEPMVPILHEEIGERNAPSMDIREVDVDVELPNADDNAEVTDNLSIADEQTDMDDDTGSLLNDDVQLVPEEHVVPLMLEGRQRAMYIAEISRNEDLLTAFLDARQHFNRVEEVENVLRRLKEIETHVDLVYSESMSEVGAPTQAQWDVENSVKFRFLGALLHELRERDMNIIIVIKKDNERLFEILEKFLKGRFFNYKYPAKSRVANLVEVEGQLMVTLLTGDASFITRPPNAIICLDGANAAQIRKKNWAINPDRVIVPIIDLEIPRTVGHIERCVSSKLTSEIRSHTVLASLGHVRLQIGRPLVATPRPVEAAELVAKYLMDLEENEVESPEWPLPPIHSVKDLVETLSQRSQDSRTPPSGPTTKSSKRPLDSQELEPTKRMRMTPQPQQSSSVGANVEAETTHVSDSMPGTAIQLSKLQEQLAEKQRALDKAVATSKGAHKRYRELEGDIDRRQTEYEEMKERFKNMMKELGAQKKLTEQADKAKELAQQRNEKLRDDNAQLRTQLTEQQQVNLASDDEKIAEITRWRKEFEQEESAKESAIKSKGIVESTMEYIKDQLRSAQDQATEWKDAYDTTAAELAALKAQVESNSSVPQLKNTHDNRVADAWRKKYEATVREKAISDRLLAQKEDELSRTKADKKAYGTRQGSVPRSPRVGGPGSRAASPMQGNRDRVSNLRNG